MPKHMTRKPITRVRISLTEAWRPLKRICRGGLFGERGEKSVRTMVVTIEKNVTWGF